MIGIIQIESGSIAEELNIRSDSKLISINDREIHDELDYRFYSNGEELEVLIEQDGEHILYDIEKAPHQDIGLILEDMKIRKCGNNCIFCFVHQNPQGLRKALYFKDEDYRFSFLHGHYVTLTNTTQKDLDRIVKQRLSPLYVSVHVTDNKIRKTMLGRRTDDFLLEKLEFLTKNGIELHTQVVLCPGINDGLVLEKTIADLKAFFPNLGSIAIVPVGLTRFRADLPKLSSVSAAYSKHLMSIIDAERRQLKAELGSAFVYLADEFYVSTNTSLPESEYYEEFSQLENGVGLTRDFLNQFKRELPKLEIPASGLDLTLVSGVLGTMVLQNYILPHLQTLSNLRISLHNVTNRFYGESVTVAGLLVGEDIYNALKDKPLGDYVILPPRVLNHDRLFLDDWSIDQLENRLGVKVLIFPESFVGLFEKINTLQ